MTVMKAVQDEVHHISQPQEPLNNRTVGSWARRPQGAAWRSWSKKEKKEILSKPAVRPEIKDPKSMPATPTVDLTDDQQMKSGGKGPACLYVPVAPYHETYPRRKWQREHVVHFPWPLRPLSDPLPSGIGL